MHLTTFNALRVVVTLACLIGVPILALVGIGGKSSSGEPIKRSAASSTPRRSTKEIIRQPVSNAANQIAQSQGGRPERAELPLPAAARITAEEVRVSPSPAESHASAEPTSADSPPADAMSTQLRRLQSLGATYYRLESSPDRPGEFWFSCRMPGNDRPIEAFDRTPLAAIERVVVAVEGIGARAAEPATIEVRAATATQRTAGQRSSSVYRR